jgi:hypothetical protein
MKMFKKTMAVLVVFAAALLPASSVWAAAQVSSALIKGKNGVENSLEHDIGDGITLTCEGVSVQNTSVWVGYSILSEKDVMITIGELTDLFDDRGRTVKAPGFQGFRRVLIGGNLGSEREIIAGVKTPIAIGYYLRRKYEPSQKYARVSININNKNEIFRNVPSTSSEFDVDVYGEKVTFLVPSEPFSEFQGHLYKIFPDEVTWDIAVKKSEEMGGHLCTITSEEEEKFIFSILPVPLGDYWLGATDAAQEGDWKWVTGEEFKFSSWPAGQPDNDGRREHCLSLKGSWNGAWNDYVGYGKLRYICEWE